MKPSTQPPPPGWGNDKLSMLMERTYLNRQATFANKPVFGLLSEIGHCFEVASSNWTNPTDIVAAALLIRSYAAFFTACETATASAVADTFPNLRSSLEYAAYALHIRLTPGLSKVWLDRHKSDASRAAVRKAFTLDKLRSSIRSKDRHTDQIFYLLYEEAIDFGGHPNERAVTGSWSIRDTHDGKEFNQLWFHSDGPQLDYIFRRTAQTGICALQILQNVFPERFELLGVNARILQLRQGL